MRWFLIALAVAFEDLWDEPQRDEALSLLQLRASAVSNLTADRVDSEAEAGGWKEEPRKVCPGTAYTANRRTKCDGWKRLSKQACINKCQTNAQAPRCPKKTCVAAAFYPRNGHCHLYSSCDGRKGRGTARLLVKPQATPAPTPKPTATPTPAPTEVFSAATPPPTPPPTQPVDRPGYVVVGQGHCAASGRIPYHFWGHGVSAEDCVSLCTGASWCAAFHWGPVSRSCAVFVDPAAPSPAAPPAFAARFDLGLDEVTGTDLTAHASDATCYKKVPPTTTTTQAPLPPFNYYDPHENGHVNLDNFVAAQLATAEACAAKQLEARRTADGMGARVFALKQRYEGVKQQEAVAREQLAAAEVALADDPGRKKELQGAVSNATGIVMRAEHELLALAPVVLEAYDELTKVERHLEHLKRTCVEAGEVSVHLERVRNLIAILPACPGRNDFVLDVPGEPTSPEPTTPEPTTPEPTTTTTTTTTPIPVCKDKVEFVIVVDGSVSLTEEGFQSAVAFVKTLVSYLDISAEAVRVGVIQYSADEKYFPEDHPKYAEFGKVETSLTWSRSRLNTAIDEMAFLKEGKLGTYTGEALKMAGQMLQGARRDARKAVLVLSDGGATDWATLRTEAQALKDRDVRLMFGIIRYPGMSLWEVMGNAYSYGPLASQPSTQNVFNDGTYEDFANRVTSYATAACRASR